MRVGNCKLKAVMSEQSAEVHRLWYQPACICVYVKPAVCLRYKRFRKLS